MINASNHIIPLQTVKESCFLKINSSLAELQKLKDSTHSPTADQLYSTAKSAYDVMELQLQALADLLVDMNIPVKPIQPSNNSQHNELDAKSHRAIWETPITSRTFNNDFASDLLDETIIDYQDNTSPLEYPDSPTYPIVLYVSDFLSRFDDLGLSSLSMDLLGNVEMTKPIKDKNLTATTFSDIQNKSERGYSSDFQPPSLRKYTSHLPDRYHSDRESIDSLTPPTLKNDTYIDTNNSCQSIFNQALTLSTESEYQSLDLGVTTQITKKYLDDVIQGMF
ncbi:hypothetical protein HDV02_005286 [Globomyces sp. JEL0801]|nr:hypothetical protein HDV02_005286 [Globomyces sp. JEL0801]